MDDVRIIEDLNMRTQSADTRIEAEKVLISLYREASTAKKFSQIRSLSRTVLLLSKRAIARANNELSEREIEILFVSVHYGKELANNLERYLETIEHEDS